MWITVFRLTTKRPKEAKRRRRSRLMKSWETIIFPIFVFVGWWTTTCTIFTLLYWLPTHCLSDHITSTAFPPMHHILTIQVGCDLCKVWCYVHMYTDCPASQTWIHWTQKQTNYFECSFTQHHFFAAALKGTELSGVYQIRNLVQEIQNVFPGCTDLDLWEKSRHPRQTRSDDQKFR